MFFPTAGLRRSLLNASRTQAHFIRAYATKKSQKTLKFKDVEVDGTTLDEAFKSDAGVPMTTKVSIQQGQRIENMLRKGAVKLERSAFKFEDLPEVELPEVVLLGRCNVGKSSLVNALVTPGQKKLMPLARAHRVPGYTPCLNVYNISGLFRLIDTPGYGVKGRQTEGKMVMEYLERRNAPFRCYLLLDGLLGPNQYDEIILSQLERLGVTFDIVFNKIDKIREQQRVEHMRGIIEDSVLQDLSFRPRYYFVNSKESPQLYRSGIQELRLSMLESAGLKVKEGLTPKIKSKVKDMGERRSEMKGAKKLQVVNVAEK